jgi:hypothetical protein
MRKIAPIFLAATLAALMFLLAAGCGSGSPASAAQTFMQHLNNREFGDAYDMLASGSPLKKISRDRFISNADASSPQGSRVDSFTVTSQSVNGDTATVKWRGTRKAPGAPDDPQTGAWTLNREDGQWKLQP